VVADGATVFLSSHVLAEVEQLTERVAIVRDGVVIDVEDVEALRHKAGQQITLTFAESVDPAPISALPGVTDLIATGTTVTLLLHGEPGALLRLVAPWGVVRLRAQDRELEDLFMEFYR
jgi:ABC-2 type transport system ATP-binding protein